MFLRSGAGLIKKTKTVLMREEFYEKLEEWKRNNLIELVIHMEMYNYASKSPTELDYAKVSILDRDLKPKLVFLSMEIEDIDEWEKLKSFVKRGKVKGVRVMSQGSMFDYAKSLG